MRRTQVTRIRSTFALVLASAVVFGACGDDDSSSGAIVPVVGATINVVATEQPESRLLAEIYAQGLENAGFRVGRKDPVADRAAAYQKLVDDSAQFTPEFTSSLLSFLSADQGKEVPAVAGTSETVTALNDLLPDTLVIGDPSSVSTTGSIACSTAAVDQYGLKTIGDLVEHAAEVRIAGPAGFDTATPWGLVGYGTVYGTEFTQFVEVAADGVAEAVTSGEADCGALHATDPAGVLDGLLTLTDDRKAVPDDLTVPLMSAVAASPEVLSTISQIDATLTTDVIRALLVKVTQNGGSYDLVVAEYIAAQSLSDAG
jgi:osmoprotectant transport system substrate-binding protein